MLPPRCSSPPHLLLLSPPLPPPPQWAIDMENRLSHQQQWASHILKISLHNMKVDGAEQAEWNVARFLNSIRTKDVDLLTPLPMLFARLPVPAIPGPPVPGGATNLPPLFVPPPIIVPAAHALFPVNIAALHDLTVDAKLKLDILARELELLHGQLHMLQSARRGETLEGELLADDGLADSAERTPERTAC
ncbi:hypothetical protein GGX14DRAFT_630196 [Mycena pura]|uniref:Uncharacterized protein n=1 Tax=Mycena pura TaxID=153505 RepID=A0AAD7E459_9AGAR|nr:hypothetical protein GGX14DRAFT_630196 [Mycena pura]